MSTIPDLYRLFRDLGGSRPRAAWSAVSIAWAVYRHYR